jgi:rod shape-determining protein MreC
MEALLNRYRSLTVLLVVLLAQLILVAYQVKTNQDVRLLRVWAVTSVTPMARLLEAVTGGASGAFSDYFQVIGVRQENRRLAAELDRLKMENRYFRRELGTAERAEALRLFQPTLPSRTTAVRVIGAAPGFNSKVLFVDRGSTSGVKAGMAVINPDGVVGRVSAAYPTSSQVLLITDQSFSVGVVSAKNRVEGILKGLGRSECRIYYIPRDEKVEVGEWFYTSGEDRIFPRGLPVGRVKTVGGDKTYKEIVLVPSGPARGMEELLVVLEGVHQSLPEEPATAGSAPLLAPPVSPAAAPATGPAQAAGSGTEADRLLEQYRKRAEARGGAYGDNPESRKPPEAAAPAGQAGSSTTPSAKPPLTPVAPRPATVKP